jgi:uncharacterized protein (DUF433 family)
MFFYPYLTCKQTLIWYYGSVMNYITSDPTILSGMPVITGTRIPIEVILYRLKEGYSIEAIHDLYPWVERNTLAGAIDEAIRQITHTFHAEKVS